MRPRVKICCIKNQEEALLAIRYGASALGFVSEMPSGPGVISDDKILDIAPRIPPGVARFLLTSKTDAESIITQQRLFRVNVIQLVQSVSPETHRELRDRLRGVAIVQVVHVMDGSAYEEAVRMSAGVDAILLDSGNPRLPVPELGGTGRRHDWSISRRIRDAVKIPVYLAGGLKAENVSEAIRVVEPFGVDVCSGVRTDGKLDERKLSAFFEAVG